MKPAPPSGKVYVERLDFVVDVIHDWPQQVPRTEERPVWERVLGEPLRAFHAFCHYRDMRVRSARQAYINHKKDCEGEVVSPATAPRTWMGWSVTWGWVERAAKWEDELDRLAREQITKEQVAARTRHARLTQASLAALQIPTAALLQAIQDPKVVARLVEQAQETSAGAMQLLAAVVRAGQVIPALVAAERLSLGLTVEDAAVEDRRDTDALADRIVEDPAATELAIALLDRVAHARPRAALGPGTSGEPKEVVASATPELVGEEVG